MLWGKTSRPAPRVSTLVPFIATVMKTQTVIKMARKWNVDFFCIYYIYTCTCMYLNVSLFEYSDIAVGARIGELVRQTESTELLVQ